VNVSVILCTLNPDPGLLRAALTSLEEQSHRDFELVLVDNGSERGIDEATLRARHQLDLRVVREERRGLVWARCTGIAATSGDLLVFIDDDNALDRDYLEQTVRIALRQPDVGHFGGISRAALTTAIPDWKRRLLPHLGVRDCGGEAIVSKEERWGPWEPIGAGMVTRRNIAMSFVDFVSERHSASRLGHQGEVLMSGEDALMARMSVRLGWACAYQPELKLTHFINPARLSINVLARTLEGHGRSYVVLERLLGRGPNRPNLLSALWQLCRRLAYRVKTDGLKAGTIIWFWDVGYMRQARLPE
jgi:glycosyltransferase involved in cell wall biosynthesis